MIQSAEEYLIELAFEDCEMGEYYPPKFESELKVIYDMAWYVYDEYMEGVHL